jgi:hypothetical protein
MTTDAVTAPIRFVTPYDHDDGVARYGPSQRSVSRFEETLPCNDCGGQHYQIHLDEPNDGASEARLVDDFEPAYALALTWLPEADEYFGRRVADDDDDEHNSAWRFDSAHEAVFWLLETP